MKDIALTKDPAFIQFYQKCREDPWFWAVNCVRTKDEVDRNAPIKRFPSQHKYLEYYFKVWLRQPLIAVPKSRRMFMSWGNIILYTWDTLFHVGRNNAFVSKKEDDSDDLVQRAKFILDNLDYSKIPKEFLPEWKYVYNKLSFPQIDSKLRGYPSGSDQLRQFTFSGMFFDEMAFWENAEKAYGAALPTIEGGGRLTAVSSPGPGFFKRIVFDTLNRG